ncbi:MAG: phage tail protein [Ferruginibacter sp.]|nr:phage tail protein [Ferruginibacter sp.]
MATSYQSPGVYVQEISHMPPAVYPANISMPLFIGYTEKNKREGAASRYHVNKISSIKEFELAFGRDQHLSVHVQFNPDNSLAAPISISTRRFNMYEAITLYFNNGGGPCYIVSCGSFTAGRNATPGRRYRAMHAALDIAGGLGEACNIIFPDAGLLVEEITVADSQETRQQKTVLYHKLFKDALSVAELTRGFVLTDVYQPKIPMAVNSLLGLYRTGMRDKLSAFGAAYFPNIKSSFPPYINEESYIAITLEGGTGLPARPVLRKETAGKAVFGSLFHHHLPEYQLIRNAIDQIRFTMPPSSAVAAVCANVDNTRGCWKAPSNIPLSLVEGPTLPLTTLEMEGMNVSPDGISVNAIRSFTGKGTMVWGARTLLGNDNEWRYISVRRFANMIEVSVKKALLIFCFEPNGAATWVKIKAMIENFLILQWRNGALMGATPREAFFVKTGLGETMTINDINEGRLVVEIGLAATRPAEFIILKFTQQMPGP